MSQNTGAHPHMNLNQAIAYKLSRLTCLIARFRQTGDDHGQLDGGLVETLVFLRARLRDMRSQTSAKFLSLDPSNIGSQSMPGGDARWRGMHPYYSVDRFRPYFALVDRIDKALERPQDDADWLDGLRAEVTCLEAHNDASCSRVDGSLAKDPAGLWNSMHGASKHVYRAAVDDVAHALSCPPERIAACALSLARQAEALSQPPRECHIGHYLIDDGISTLRETFGGTRAVSSNPHPTLSIDTCVALLFATGLALITWMIISTTAPAIEAIILTLLFCVVMTGPLMRMVHYRSSISATRKISIKRDYRLHGIPESSKTVVMLPILLTGQRQYREALRRFQESTLIANDSNATFVVVTSVKDCADVTELAEQETLRSAFDAEFLSFQQKMAEIFPGQAFLHVASHSQFFPRDCIWTVINKKWGCITEIMRLTRGREGALTVRQGDANTLIGAKYLMVLDEDAVLARDALQDMVGVLDHRSTRLS